MKIQKDFKLIWMDVVGVGGNKKYLLFLTTSEILSWTSIISSHVNLYIFMNSNHLILNELRIKVILC